MSSFKFDMGGILKGIAEKEIKTRVALGLYADVSSKKLEAKAKSNYKWVPKSGRAHQSINGTWKWVGNTARVELSHGVDYGIYLEMCNERRYAIIKPTIDAESPAIFKGLSIIWK